MVDLPIVVVPAVHSHASLKARVLIVQWPGTSATPQTPGVPRTSAYAEDSSFAYSLAASTALHYARRCFRADNQPAGTLRTSDVGTADAAVACTIATRILDFRLRIQQNSKIQI
ncbi:hypothetical protein ALC57_18096 [Trachymyrmex cornetzi]|uniref:Uncharacterized protein n=1 Tax=Trachymyrmex cornetzi TaxID=471704 RepID=A0A151ISI4_9HYME|nr:hypothetical protein ALC57_18096 [Trachymyrmex cornetzi]